MNATLTRIAMALPIVAALLALTAGWASAQPGPDFPGDITTNQPVVDPQPQPPKWQHVPVLDLGDITVDPDPAPPADTDDSDHDADSDHSDNSSHGTTTGGTSVRPAVHNSDSVGAETDTAFEATAAGDTSEQIAPKFVGAGPQQVPDGLVFGIAGLLVAVIGWAAFRHHRLSV